LKVRLTIAFCFAAISAFVFAETEGPNGASFVKPSLIEP